MADGTPTSPRKVPVSPYRRVTGWTAGAGTDVLQLDCGHQVIRNHKNTEPKKARCHNCRVWE